MASTAQAVSEHRNAATPYLSVRNAAAAIEFYKRAFGATEAMRLMQPDGRIGHAEINIGGARIMLADEFPEAGFRSPESLGGSPIHIHLDVADVDAVAAQAIAAGAKVVRPVADQFYGDRSGQIADPFGYTWVISTRKEEMSAAEMQRRLDAFMESQTSATAEGEKKVNPIREGFKTITPYLVISGAARWIDFMKGVFEAEEKFRTGPPGTETIMHAELKIGDSMIEVADANPQYPAMPSTLSIRASDPDAMFSRAIAAGAEAIEPMTDKEYGTRAGIVRDVSGNSLFIFAPLPGDKLFINLRSITPHLYADNGSRLIAFLRDAFGGEEVYRAQLPDGSIPHAQIRIGDSLIVLAGATGRGEHPARPTSLHLYVPNTDALYEQALRAGAESIQPPTDQPYGDRSAGVRDPFGNLWFIATHVRDVIG